MKKKLVAVAVAGVLGAPLAAHAQSANVTLYGRLNLDLEFVHGEQPDGSNPRVARLSANSSRFGVRGSESLGGGLSAIFQIESDVRGDTSNPGGWSTRETFVGFQGGWGTFKMGKFLMPEDDMHGIFGNVPTYLTSILSTASLWAQGTQSKDNGGFDARLGNSLRYDSPSFNGLTFSGQVALKDTSGPAGTGDGTYEQQQRHAFIWGGNAIYNNGPIQVGVAFEQNRKVRGVDLNDTDITVTGGYNFGVVRLAGLYEHTKYETPSGDLKRDMWGISGTIPMGPGTWYAFVGRALDGKGGAADGTRIGGLAKGGDTSSTQWEISYTYPFSKRTSVYAGYVKIDNDRNASYTFNINPYPVAAGGKPDGIVLGMIHLF